MTELGLHLIWPNPLQASDHQGRNPLRCVVISNTAELFAKNLLTGNEDLVNGQDNLNKIHHILKEMPTLGQNTLELPKIKWKKALPESHSHAMAICPCETNLSQST